MLDSIAYALGGKSLIPAHPVRAGQQEADIQVTLDGDPPLIVRRRWNKKGNTTLEVFEDYPNGKAKLSSPQKILDAMCGRIAFDPLEFATMKPADQVATLKQVIGIDTTMIDGQIEAAVSDRADINRRVRDLEGEVKSFPSFDGIPDDEVDTGILAQKLESAHEHNNKLKNLEQIQARLIREGEDISDHIRDLKKQLDVCGRDFEENRSAQEKCVAAIKEFEPMEVEDIKEQIATASETNAAVQQKRRKHIVETKWKAAMAEAEDATATIQRLRHERLEMAEKAEWPIPDLDFAEDGVTYRDLPFNQASQAEQLRVAVAIGMAMNPQIKVLLIRDGSLLDEKSMALLTELATEAGGQVWVERVGKNDDCMVVIEDGLVE